MTEDVCVHQFQPSQVWRAGQSMNCVVVNIRLYKYPGIQEVDDLVDR